MLFTINMHIKRSRKLNKKTQCSNFLNPSTIKGNKQKTNILYRQLKKSIISSFIRATLKIIHSKDFVIQFRKEIRIEKQIYCMLFFKHTTSTFHSFTVQNTF